MIDLRSDTVTKPSAAMREAMAAAEVGDDVFGEDPTVNRLQEHAARLLGKEAALFVASGTMANQTSLLAHTRPGDEIVLERGSHILNHEAGALGALAGVQTFVLDGNRGVIEPSQIEQAIRFNDVHFPPTRLVWIENTHNRGGGAVFPLETMRGIREIADAYGLALHMDGARLFNACAASDVPPDEYAKQVDSLSFCLSKGLGAPVGSIIAGSAEFMKRVHRYRKMLGGGMRQVGILAAAGLYALEHNVQRLAEDHRNARRLAEALAAMDGVTVTNEPVETNLVFIDISRTNKNALEVMNEARELGLLFLPESFTELRAVTHLDVSADDIEQAIEIFRGIFCG
ncbi:MAG: low-specificity L-threonine aldolase [Candidatus Abyssobacteria bacterium SURF_5]|uniref:Low-specificity L-threonine aldolase n=1 Tax=Abyssobacteria bacterium (strain SURF_5) TaxID=2093360 RepID=A0A3A4NYZ6_ABYX5|nr:MAG: low-specificity L-threonine aldolase [Candidatus Abyssubacteria bacterium SURF_5]